MARQQLYDQIWAELDKHGYDMHDEVIPYIIFNEACDAVGTNPDDIIDDFSEQFNVDIG